LPQILRHNARFDYEKLLWLQGEYARTRDDRLRTGRPCLRQAGVNTNALSLPYVKPRSTRARASSSCSANCPLRRILFTDKIEYDAEAAKKDFAPENKPRLEKLRDAFAAAPAFNAGRSKPRSRKPPSAGRKAGVLVHPCRWP